MISGVRQIVMEVVTRSSWMKTSKQKATTVCSQSTRDDRGDEETVGEALARGRHWIKIILFEFLELKH